MKRIISGHYSDLASSWAVCEILPEEFSAVKDSIRHIKIKYRFMLELSDDGWRESINKSNGNLTAMSLDEFSIPDKFIEDARKVISRDLDIATALEARIILLALSNTYSEIKELSSDEFRVLIDSIRNLCIDLTNVVNSSREELAEAVNKINKDNNLIDEERLNEGLNKVSNEEYKDKTYERVKVLYSILEAINHPYDKEHLDEYESKSNISINKNKSTSIN